MQERVVIGGDLNLINVIDGDMSLHTVIDGEAGVFIPVYPDPYAGPTTFTPSQETQTVYTAGLTVPSNITIEPIPSNYGLITYNGTIITVS